MKTLRTFAALLFTASTMMLLQGCVWPNWSYNDNSYSSTTATTVNYHFNSAEFFNSKDRKIEQPFRMQGGNISTSLLNPKESFDNPDKFKYVNFSGATNQGGGNLRLTVATKKKWMFTVNYLTSSKKDVANGYVTTAATVTSTPMEYGWFWTLVPSSNSSTWETTKGMPYTVNHNRSQTDYEFAAGRIAFIGNHGSWESFAGLGISQATNAYNYSFGDEESNNYYSYNSSNHFYESFIDKRTAYRLFLQNNIGYTTRITEGAFGSRLTYLHFTNQDFKATTPIPDYEMERGALLLEPSVHFGIGFNNFKLYSEYSWAIPLSGSDVKWEKTNFKFGAAITF